MPHSYILSKRCPTPLSVWKKTTYSRRTRPGAQSAARCRRLSHHTLKIMPRRLFCLKKGASAGMKARGHLRHVLLQLPQPQLRRERAVRPPRRQLEPWARPPQPRVHVLVLVQVQVLRAARDNRCWEKGRRYTCTYKYTVYVLEVQLQALCKVAAIFDFRME